MVLNENAWKRLLKWENALFMGNEAGNLVKITPMSRDCLCERLLFSFRSVPFYCLIRDDTEEDDDDEQTARMETWWGTSELIQACCDKISWSNMGSASTNAWGSTCCRTTLTTKSYTFVNWPGLSLFANSNVANWIPGSSSASNCVRCSSDKRSSMNLTIRCIAVIKSTLVYVWKACSSFKPRRRNSFRVIPNRAAASLIPSRAFNGRTFTIWLMAS